MSGVLFGIFLMLVPDFSHLIYWQIIMSLIGQCMSKHCYVGNTSVIKQISQFKTKSHKKIVWHPQVIIRHYFSKSCGTKIVKVFQCHISFRLSVLIIDTNNM